MAANSDRWIGLELQVIWSQLLAVPDLVPTVEQTMHVYHHDTSLPPVHGVFFDRSMMAQRWPANCEFITPELSTCDHLQSRLLVDLTAGCASF